MKNNVSTFPIGTDVESMELWLQEFKKELKTKKGYPHHYHKNEYWIRIDDVLGKRRDSH